MSLNNDSYLNNHSALKHDLAHGDPRAAGTAGKGGRSSGGPYDTHVTSAPQRKCSDLAPGEGRLQNLQGLSMHCPLRQRPRGSDSAATTFLVFPPRGKGRSVTDDALGFESGRLRLTSSVPSQPRALWPSGRHTADTGGETGRCLEHE